VKWITKNLHSLFIHNLPYVRINTKPTNKIQCKMHCILFVGRVARPQRLSKLMLAMAGGDSNGQGQSLPY